MIDLFVQDTTPKVTVFSNSVSAFPIAMAKSPTCMFSVLSMKLAGVNHSSGCPTWMTAKSVIGSPAST